MFTLRKYDVADGSKVGAAVPEDPEPVLGEHRVIARRVGWIGSTACGSAAGAAVKRVAEAKGVEPLGVVTSPGLTDAPSTTLP